MNIVDMDVLTLRENLLNKNLKVYEVIEAFLKRIEQTEDKIDALLYINKEKALEEAKILDQKGPDPDKPLWGIPCTIKDILTTKDIPTTCASKILENFVPFYDAEAVKRLKDAGAIILAKANMDEFAMGSSNENSAFKITKNPWNLEKVPGGSSGGSAASVSARQAPFSLGSDTGGSIRLPASFCGVVGLKPTYGRVSRFGLIAYGSSLDQVGPITRTVKDAALILKVIAGKDEKDSTSSPMPVEDYLNGIDELKDLQGIKIGIPKEYWETELDEDVREECEKVVETLKRLKAEIVPISLPHTPYTIATYYIIIMAEASSNLARYDGVRYGFRYSEAKDFIDMFIKSRSLGFGPEVQRRIVLGTYVLSAGYYDAFYKKAAQVRRLIQEDFFKGFEKCQIMCAPVSPTPAFKIGEKADPLQMYLSDVFTASINLAGIPAISIPAGIGKRSKLPVGIQFFAMPFKEKELLKITNLIEKEIGQLPKPFELERS